MWEPIGPLVRVFGVSRVPRHVEAPIERSPAAPWDPSSPAIPTPTPSRIEPGPATPTDPAISIGSGPAPTASSNAGHDGAGDFPTFYRRELDGLYRALALAIGDADLAQEAIDEAMSRAYQRWRRIGRYDSPGGWVYRVGLNWARSRLRKTRREVPDSERAARRDGHHPDDAAAGLDPDLHRALTLLSTDARTVVVLRYLLEWSTKDTAVALGVAPGTVKSRLSRALTDLEIILREREPR